MGTIELDNARDVTRDGFDPLKTPYEVESGRFPRDGTLEEQYTHLLRYAILAPSSYNTQPWKFRLYDNGIAVFADYTRRLPVADPNNRELLMGVGAAIMNLRVAAEFFGFAVQVEYNFSGDSELPLAFVTLTRILPARPVESEREKMFRAIVARHTNRHPFVLARVPEAILARLAGWASGTEASIFTSAGAKLNGDVAHLVARAERLQHSDPEFRKELGGWMRPNTTHQRDGMPGAAFGLSDVASAMSPWAVRTMDLGGIRARHDERLCVEAPALLVLHGEDSVPAWLAVGEVLEKVLLALTRDGLHYSFFNMPIEIPEARLELRQLLGINSRPQLLLRIGYSREQPAPTPRRPVEDCIVR